mgnify:CR=1 FL=1
MDNYLNLFHFVIKLGNYKCIEFIKQLFEIYNNSNNYDFISWFVETLQDEIQDIHVLSS